MIFTTGTTANLLKVSRETIRTWAEEFSRYLSAVANPGEGKHRQFTDEDLKVLAVIARLKRTGRTYDDIHTVLESGEREEVDTDALLFGTGNREITILQAQITDLQEELETAIRERNEAKTASAVDKALREQSEQRAAALEKEVRSLLIQIGRLEARMDDN